jgi:DNA-binding response OmpR family regulator
MIAPTLPEARAVLVADRNRRNVELVAALLDAAGFEPRAIGSLDELDLALGDDGTIGLALVDASSFDVRLVAGKLVPHGVPLLVFTDERHRIAAQRCIGHGARGVLQKPLLASELLWIVRGLVGVGALHEPDPAAHRT